MHAMEKLDQAPIYELISDPKASQILPSLGVIIAQLQDLTGSPDTRVQEITELIRADQSLTVKILRLANSAFYAPSEPILHIDEAVIFLGLSQVRNAILTSKLIEQSSVIPTELLSWHDFWVHEIATAVVVQELSTYMRETRMTGEAYYVMGLFHDIGKLVLAMLAPELFTRVLRETAERRCDIAPVEIDLVGLNHASIGAWYLQQQGLPPSLYEAIRIHHSWSYSPGNVEEGAMISLADQIVHLFRLGASGTFFPDDWNPGDSPEWAAYREMANPMLPAWPDLLLHLWERVGHVPSLLDTLASGVKLRTMEGVTRVG
jgi:HD-like signal output (HDOD) protein